MGRCNICGRTLANPIVVKEPRYSIKENGEVNVCPKCFKFLISEDHQTLLDLIKIKLKGEGYDVEEVGI